jgi:hypothetical protein
MNKNKNLNLNKDSTSKKLKSKNVKNVKTTKIKKTMKMKMENAKKLKDNVIKMNDKQMEIDMEMEMANLSKKTNRGKVDFDKILMDCLKDKDLITSGMNKNERNRHNKNYENSFEEIMKFRENVSKEDIQQIDTIIFHAENNDGAFSASIAYHYFMTVLFKNNLNKQNNFQIIPDKPRSEVKRVQNRNMDKLRGKNVLILDIEYHPSYIQHLQEICANVFMIDDHISNLKIASDKLFIGTNHAVCANTFKFFYPNETLPPVVKIENPILASVMGACLATKRSTAEKLQYGVDIDALVFEPYANPFRTYPLIDDYNKFKQLFENNNVECYIINTGHFLIASLKYRCWIGRVTSSKIFSFIVASKNWEMLSSTISSFKL